MQIVELIIALILSLTLHEFMHGYVGFLLGDDTAKDQGRLTLNPLAHIDPFMTLLLPLLLILAHAPVFGAAKPVPFKPWALRYGKWGAAMVAVAGPLTNLFLAIFFGLWVRFIPLYPSAAQLFVAIVEVNIGFFIFNMIPFPPLDGSRVLYAIAPYGLREIMDRIERAGIIAIAIFIFFLYPYLAPLLNPIFGTLLSWLIPHASLLQ